jgi:hypothetical protein
MIFSSYPAGMYTRKPFREIAKRRSSKGFGARTRGRRDGGDEDEDDGEDGDADG